MAKILKKARFILNRSEVTGKIPTLPPNDDHTDGWIGTDIYQGELFVNIYDDRIWFRDYFDEMKEMVVLKDGKIPEGYLDGPLIYQSTWDASSGSAPSADPTKGYFWVVTVSGNTNLSGETDWQIGDYAIYNGNNIWDKIDNSEPILTANNILYDKIVNGTTYTNVQDPLDDMLDVYSDYTAGTDTNISITGTYSNGGNGGNIIITPGTKGSGNNEDGDDGTIIMNGFLSGDVKIKDRIYTKKGTTTSGTVTIINNAVPGDWYLISAQANNYSYTGSHRYISAIVKVYLNSSTSTNVNAVISDLGSQTAALSVINRTTTNCDISLGGLYATSAVFEWSILKLN